ncbi:hypothetical protein ACFX15_031635 [Malus domestica]
MVSSCSTPGFPPVHDHPTRLSTMDARLSAALDFLVASMHADLRAIRDSDFAFCKAVESAVAPIRCHLALLRHDLALGAGEGSGPASMSFDDVEIPDLGHQKFHDLGYKTEKAAHIEFPRKSKSIPFLRYFYHLRCCKQWQIRSWVGLYEVGKFVMVFNAEKVLDEIAKRQSEDAAGNLFDRMTPLFHNMVICSQFCINIGEFWNGWDPGGGLAKILGVMLCSKNHENHGDKYPQFFKTQLHFINHPMHFTCLLQVMQYEKSTATCESVFNISGDRNSFIDAGNAGKLDKVLNVVDSMLDDDGVEFFTNPNKKTMLFLNLTDLKVLVTDNIQEYVKSGKHVLLEFYAPWCGHCKKFPILHEVVVSDEKDSDVVIAKLRATVNGVPSDFDVKYF